MSITFPCIECKEEVTMIYGVKVCPNCFKGYWLWDIQEDWQKSEDDFLVTDDGKYLVVPFDPGSGKKSLRGRILSRLRRLSPPWH
jgi:hypothetical protein